MKPDDDPFESFRKQIYREWGVPSPWVMGLITLVVFSMLGAGIWVTRF